MAYFTLPTSSGITQLTGDATAGPGTGSQVVTITGLAYSKLTLTNSIVNADINASAAIAYSKLALTGAVLATDLAGSIPYSKLVLTGAVLNTDLAGSIAYSKLSLTGAILNADLAGSIAYSKLSLTGAILNADLAGSIAYSKLTLTGAVLATDLAGSIPDSKLSTIATAGKISDAALPSSMATKTFTGVTSFPGSSSIDGSGNAAFGGTLSVTGASTLTGSVGIGRTPTSQLDVFSNAVSGTGGPTLTLKGNENSNTATSTIAFYNGGNANNYPIAKIDGFADGGTNTGTLRFFTTPTGGAFTERMRIDSAGNVGLGRAATSTFQLDIFNTTLVGTTVGSNNIALISSNGNGRDASLKFGDNFNTSAQISYLSGALNFRTNAATAMTIATSGAITMVGDLVVGGANSSAPGAALYSNGNTRTSLAAPNGTALSYNLNFGGVGGLLIVGDFTSGKQSLFLVNASATLISIVSNPDNYITNAAVSAASGFIHVTRSGVNLLVTNETSIAASIAVTFIKNF